MKLNLILYRITHTSSHLAATAALLTMGVWGCSDGRNHVVSNEPEAAAEEAAPERDVWLKLRVSVAAPATSGSRAGDSAGHPDEAATADESYIDCTKADNLSLMFFDDRQMLWRVFNPEDMAVEPAGTDGAYNLRFKINSDYFQYAGTEGDVVCSYMLVANLDGTASGTTFSVDNLFAKTPAEIAATYAGFGMPDQSTTAWMPSIADGRLIPMSGIARCTISRDNFNNSTSYATAADMGALYLQRAMAKIRILDAVPLQQEVDFDRIMAVTLVGANTRGAYIPQGTPAWYGGTTDVEAATELPEWFAPDSRIRLLNVANQTSTVEGKTYANGFVCYVPECKLTGRQTKLIITVREKNSTATRNFEVVLSQPSGSYPGMNALARNHIYEFKVEMSTIGRPALTYTVCPWDEYLVSPPPFN